MKTRVTEKMEPDCLVVAVHDERMKSNSHRLQQRQFVRVAKH